MRWKTNHPDGDCYDGVVLDIKRRFVIIREEVSFGFDGLMVLPKKSLKGYRDGPFEQCTNEILESNGARETLNYPPWMKECDTLFQLFDGLKRRDIWPGVEVLYDDGQDYEFHLGQLTEAGPSEFRLMGCDAKGQWEHESSLSYAQVFRVEINSLYCDRFSEYMRTKVVRF